MEKLDWKISKAMRRMQRRRERHTAMRIARKLSAVVLLMGAAVMFSGAASQPTAGRITVEHTVQPEETLWGIASRYCGDTYVLEYLHKIREENPSVQDGRIYPGQVIKLTYEE